MSFIRIAFFLSIFSLAVTVAFGQSAGSIAGSVTDSLGAVVPGATVTAVAADGTQKQVVANKNGEYTIAALKAGVYTVRSLAPKFALYEHAAGEVTAGPKSDLLGVLSV